MRDDEERVDLKYWIFGAIALLVIGGAVLRATAPAPDELPPVEAQAPQVETIQVVAEPVVPRARLSGLLEPRRSVEIFSETEGRVLEVGADELASVQAGQLLARLDDTRARIELARAEAARERAASQTILARADLERNRGLAKRDAASRAALDQSENASRLARAATLDAEAGIEDARDQLRKTRIEAPFAGVLRSFPVEMGEYLRPGERIAELLDVDQLRVTIGLSDRQVVSVAAESVVEIEVDALPGETFEGRIAQVGAAMDPGNRKFPVRIEIPNQDRRLLPGMVAEIELELGGTRRLILVPREAVVKEFGMRHLYVVEPQGEAGHVAVRRKVEVRELPFDPTRVEIASGLAAGEWIAIRGLRQLSDGLAVRPERRSEPPGLAAGRAATPEEGS